jgi:hypothetical protein
VASYRYWLRKNANVWSETRDSPDLWIPIQSHRGCLYLASGLEPWARQRVARFESDSRGRGPGRVETGS